MAPSTLFCLKNEFLNLDVLLIQRYKLFLTVGTMSLCRKIQKISFYSGKCTRTHPHTDKHTHAHTFAGHCAHTLTHVVIYSLCDGNHILSSWYLGRHYLSRSHLFPCSPAYATPKLMDRIGLQLSDIDIFEYHEAFAVSKAYSLPPSSPPPPLLSLSLC